MTRNVCKYWDTPENTGSLMSSAILIEFLKAHMPVCVPGRQTRQKTFGCNCCQRRLHKDLNELPVLMQMRSIHALFLKIDCSQLDISDDPLD